MTSKWGCGIPSFNHWSMIPPVPRSHQTWQGGDLTWGASTHKITWICNHVALPDNVTNKKHYTSTIIPMATKCDRLLDTASSVHPESLSILIHGSIYGPALFLLYINDLPDDVIAIYADDTTLYSKCDQAPDLWQQLKLASELESDLQDTVDPDRKWFVDFSARKPMLLMWKWMSLLSRIIF